MIVKTQTENHKCHHCKNENIRKNGDNTSGYLHNIIVKIVDRSKILDPKQKYNPERKEEILKEYYEGGSMRRINLASGQ